MTIGKYSPLTPTAEIEIASSNLGGVQTPNSVRRELHTDTQTHTH